LEGLQPLPFPTAPLGAGGRVERWTRVGVGAQGDKALVRRLRLWLPAVSEPRGRRE